MSSQSPQQKLMLDSETNWSSWDDQQVWFDRYKSHDSDGLKFQQFKHFLQETVYCYFSRFPKSSIIKDSDKTNDKQPDDIATNGCRFSHQQEMQLFKVFDGNNDHIIDRDEFHQMCTKWLEKIYEPSCALVVVDVQNDFIDGSLALINGPARQDGAEVVPVINDLIDLCNFQAIVYTQDWHPPDHIGFHANLHMRKYKLKHNNESKLASRSNEPHLSEQQVKVKHPNQSPLTTLPDTAKKVNISSADPSLEFKLQKLAPRAAMFDTVLFDDGQVEQKLWPTHCVQNSWGAELHPKLRVVDDAVRIYKGTLPHVDAYSAFWDNMRLNETGLRQELLARDVKDVFFCGLAFDYCVAASALDSAKAGFVTFVIEDACRGIDRQEIEQRRDELVSNGVLIVNSRGVKGYLNRKMTRGYHCGNITNNNNNNDYNNSVEVNADDNNHKKLPVDCGASFDQNMMKSICFRRALI